MLNLTQCYRFAWKGFKKGWIILCLISALIVAFEVVPRIAVNSDYQSLKSTGISLVKAMLRNDRAAVARITPLVKYQSSLLSRRLLRITLYAFPFIALLTIILLMRANYSVKGTDTAGKKNSIPALLYISLAHVVMAILKLAAFFLLIIPGVFLYIRLLFVSLIMLEEELDFLPAIKRSWAITRGSFFRLFLLVMINSILQITAAFTIVGLIPVTGFVNTVRAAAHLQVSSPRRKI